MLCRYMSYITEYLPQSFFSYTEKLSSQQMERKKGREGNFGVHHRTSVGRKRLERIIRAIVRKDRRPEDDAQTEGRPQGLGGAVSEDWPVLQGLAWWTSSQDVMKGKNSSHASIKEDNGGFQAWSKLKVEGSQSLIAEAALKLDA